MARTRIEEIEALIDPMIQFDFEMVIPRMPGAIGYNPKEFQARIMTTSKPGREIEANTEELHGMTFESAGRTQYSRKLNFEVLELRDANSTRWLNEWHRFIRDDSSGGAFKSEYMITVDLQHYNSKRILIETIRLHKCWLSAYEDAAVDGSSSASVTRSGTLTYSRHELIN